MISKNFKPTRPLPQELINRGYCEKLYRERCKPIPVKREQLHYDPIMIDFGIERPKRECDIIDRICCDTQLENSAWTCYAEDLKNKKIDLFYYKRNNINDTMNTFQKGNRPEHGKSLSLKQKIKNRILNLKETKELNKKGLNQIEEHSLLIPKILQDFC